jgi:hypothetical protein
MVVGAVRECQRGTIHGKNVDIVEEVDLQSLGAGEIVWWQESLAACNGCSWREGWEDFSCAVSGAWWEWKTQCVAYMQRARVGGGVGAHGIIAWSKFGGFGRVDLFLAVGDYLRDVRDLVFSLF